MKKIIFAVLAISAIVLMNSCGSKSGQKVATHRGLPESILNDTTQTTIGSSYGKGEADDQTNTNSIIYTGTIDGQYLDNDMVPVRMCTDELVWSKFAEMLYKIGVEANQYVAKGYRVDVKMRIVKPWFSHDYLEIIEIEIFQKNPVIQPCDTAQKAPVVKKPVRKRQVNGSGGSGRDGGCFRTSNEYDNIQFPQLQPPTTVIVQQQPCCCGTNITINGTQNAPITVNGNNGGGGNTGPVTPIPVKPWNDVPYSNDGGQPTTKPSFFD